MPNKDLTNEWAKRRRRKEELEIEELERVREQQRVDRETRIIAEAAKESDELQRDAKESAIRQTYSRRAYANTYRNKNKSHINKLRRERDATPMGAYKKARRRARGKKQKWTISFENWHQVWLSCPKIFCDEDRRYKTAWEMRSGDIQRGTQMRRIDTGKGWQVTNVEIVYRNQPIPAHGVVAPWDYDEKGPALPESIVEKIASDIKKLHPNG